MDADGLPIVGVGVDYSKVDPIHQKRTLAFLNHFLIRTTSFLNHFAAVCDEKLENLLIRIQRLEASMCILEAKLASIPGLDDVTSQSVQQPLPEKQTIEEPSQPATTEQIPSNEQSSNPTEPEKPKMTISQDPRYSKYFKMINLGIPVGAVKQKMITEGVDPNILDDPNAESSSKPIVQDEENDDSDVSSFSD
ncbi:WASH complex subunit 3 [Centruroides vittatus]|uniref:WASH complex subunit 3 n=1 Tax=Centruroides vittatus TaxID=120091 RepID=UPI00350F3869